MHDSTAISGGLAGGLPVAQCAPTAQPGAQGGGSTGVPDGAWFAPLGTNTGIVSASGRSSALGSKNRSPRALLQRYDLQDTSAALLPGWRVCGCMRTRLAGGPVPVVQHPEFSSVSYGGLMTCTSPWVCPVCGARISMRRQQEIETGSGNWRGKGGGFLLATFTLRHSRESTLAEVLGTLNEGHRRVRAGRIWERLVACFGLVGSITSREITVGAANGWHPHLHGLWFLKKPLLPQEVAAFSEAMSERWIKSLQRIGGDATKKNGFNLVSVNTTNDDAFKEGTDYVIKQGSQWSAVDEVVGGGVKQAKRGNRSIAELLKDAGYGDADAACLYREYAACTKRRNLVVWTPGLRALCAVEEEEKTDEQIAAEEQAGGAVVCVLVPDQWAVICGQKLRGKLLAAFVRGGVDELAAWFTLYGIELAPWQWGGEGKPVES
jgi:hypothetical protein